MCCTASSRLWVLVCARRAFEALALFQGICAKSWGVGACSNCLHTLGFLLYMLSYVVFSTCECSQCATQVFNGLGARECSWMQEDPVRAFRHLCTSRVTCCSRCDSRHLVGHEHSCACCRAAQHQTADRAACAAACAPFPSLAYSICTLVLLPMQDMQRAAMNYIQYARTAF